MKHQPSLILLAAASMVPACHAQLLFSDGFGYSDGSLVSGNPAWVSHTASPGFVLAVSGNQARINQATSLSGGEDIHRPLGVSINGQTDNTTELFYSMTVNVSTIGSFTGSYFAHLINDDDNTPFIGRLGTVTQGTATGKFRVSIQNADWTSSGNVEFPQDLDVGVSYAVVVRYSFATDQTTLWLNPTSIASTSVTAVDAVDYATGSPQGINFNAFALRQGTSAGSFPGDVLLDDLRVGYSFNDVFPVTAVVPEPEEYAALSAVSLGIFAFLRRRFAKK